MKRKVVYTDSIYNSLELEERFFADLGVDFVVPENSTDALMKEIEDCDALMVSFFEVKGEFINHLKKCRGVIRAGMGVNNLDIDELHKRGIICANVRDYCIDEVSDHALAFILASNRKITLLDSAVHSGSWNYSLARTIHSLRGQTLALWGFGAIAREVARKAEVFGLKVIAYDPFLPDAAFSQAERVKSLDLLLARADILSLHLPLSAETEKILSFENFQKLKRGVLIVNTARGGLIDEPSLIQALDEGIISGACLDVLDGESISPDHPFFARKDIILTPHIAYYSEESEIELRKIALEEVLAVLNGEKPKFIL